MKSAADKIDELGGPAKVAEMLGFDSKSGPQRVNNWKRRGIPPAILLRHMKLFKIDQEHQEAA